MRYRGKEGGREGGREEGGREGGKEEGGKGGKGGRESISLLLFLIQILQHPWITSRDSLPDHKLTFKGSQIKVLLMYMYCILIVLYISLFY